MGSPRSAAEIIAASRQRADSLNQRAAALQGGGGGGRVGGGEEKGGNGVVTTVDQDSGTVTVTLPDWIPVIDRRTGKRYFYNKKTRQTRWDAPTAGEGSS